MIKVIETRKKYWAETNEYQLEIDGNRHTFTVYDSSHEEPHWIFDGEHYDDSEEYVLEDITIEDLLSNL
jgi:hypothetical protein